MMNETFLKSLFEQAVAAADPLKVIQGHLPPAPKGKTVVIGFGKAAASMARAVEEHWSGNLTGLVVTRYEHGMDCQNIRVVEAGHPLPDAAGNEAAEEIFSRVQGLSSDDLVLCLCSGGGSALFSLPAPGLTLYEKQAVNRALLRSGANISEMNCVRKHLSAVKGGRLAVAAHPATVVTLAISDVPGDDPAVIASGPTVADPTTLADARAVVDKYKLEVSPTVMDCLNNPAMETPKPGDSGLSKSSFALISTPAEALQAAAKYAEKEGVRAVVLGDDIEGEAREVAGDHAHQALQSGQEKRVLISGGETTVTLTGTGRGGRNAEYLLSLAIELDGHPGIWAIACDTDGIDGSEDNAGAILRPDTLARAKNLGLDAGAMLANNDAYGFFDALGDLVITGPTQTNVNDFRAILIA
ncbi:MAG: glycerate kinase [Rhodospirillales bacterium]|nr:glycerate kinase [Rhodospirillales bacterium]